nr:hypothetical protein [uncultured Flavobacterium sp.]
MSLQEIKDSYSVSKGFDNWEDLVYQLGYNRPSRLLLIIDEVMKIYAMECLKLASENCYPFQQSITNENNIIK